ncbi:NuoM family protein, partial [candidate division KSB1 bacterium]
MNFIESHILSIILFLPIAGALGILLVPGEKKNLIRQITLITVLVDFIISIPVFLRFDGSSTLMQFTESFNWIPSLGISCSVGIDGISILLFMLTTFLAPIVVLSTWNAVQEHVKEFMFFILLLQTGMIGVFVSLDFFLFYVFWELMLIPMYFIIGVWGGKRRLYAAVKFFLYTMFGSVL